MRIVDQGGNELQTHDPNLGYLKKELLFVKHHEAVEAVEKQSHYETICEYPNGGKDVIEVVDVEGVEAQEAWDEYEEILRYTPYTQEELDAKEAEREEAEKNKPEYRIAELETQLAETQAALEAILARRVSDDDES